MIIICWPLTVLELPQIRASRTPRIDWLDTRSELRGGIKW